MKTVSALFQALSYTLYGLKIVSKQKSFQLELLLFLLTLLLMPFLHQAIFLKLWLIDVMLFILIFETVNTAIEVIINRISLENHELSKQAKDLGSAAVFLMMITAAISWIVILVFC